jgi:hypothetical protein
MRPEEPAERLPRDEGLSAVERALIAAVIVIAAVAVFLTF